MEKVLQNDNLQPMKTKEPKVVPSEEAEEKKKKAEKMEMEPDRNDLGLTGSVTGLKQ